MKKSLVLAMAMALGVTASAYAANPFSDVPAGHWAYDSIDKLAAAGVIEGMGDGTYQGDKTMTRYEMAQIVAKAMAKGANVDKLAAEFAEELDNLGVRVAALEKKADNVTITGQIRAEYAHRNSNVNKSNVAQNRLRTRLFLNGQINEDWAYHARLQNDAKLNNGSADNNFDLNQAWVTGKIGGLKVEAGKAPQVIADGNFYDDTMEMVKVTYGKAVKVSAFTGDNDWNGAKGNIDGFAVEFGKAVKVKAEYTHYNEVGEGADFRMYDVVAKTKLGKNIAVDYTYLNSNVDAKSSVGNVVGIAYKGANAKKVGSWGIWAKYYNQGAGTFLNHTMKAGDWALFDAFKGQGVGVSYTVAKNMVYMLDYYNLDAKGSDDNSHVIWNRLQMTF